MDLLANLKLVDKCQTSDSSSLEDLDLRDIWPVQFQKPSSTDQDAKEKEENSTEMIRRDAEERTTTRRSSECVETVEENHGGDEEAIIYVGQLPHPINNTQLRKAFQFFGPVSSATVIRDHKTGLGRGYGFVRFESSQDAEKALKKKYHYVYEWGCTVMIRTYTPRLGKSKMRRNKTRGPLVLVDEIGSPVKASSVESEVSKTDKEQKESLEAMEMESELELELLSSIDTESNPSFSNSNGARSTCSFEKEPNQECSARMEPKASSSTSVGPTASSSASVSPTASFSASIGPTVSSSANTLLPAPSTTTSAQAPSYGIQPTASSSPIVQRTASSSASLGLGPTASSSTSIEPTISPIVVSTASYYPIMLPTASSSSSFEPTALSSANTPSAITSTQAPSYGIQPTASSSAIVQRTASSSAIVQRTASTSPIVQRTASSSAIVQRTASTSPIVQRTALSSASIGLITSSSMGTTTASSSASVGPTGSSSANTILPAPSTTTSTQAPSGIQSSASSTDINLLNTSSSTNNQPQEQDSSLAGYKQRSSSSSNSHLNNTSSSSTHEHKASSSYENTPRPRSSIGHHHHHGTKPSTPTGKDKATSEELEKSRNKHLEEIEDRTFRENRAIFIGRFFSELTERHIAKHFAQFGTIVDIRTYRHAFCVEFARKREAAIAIREMNGKEWGRENKMFICDWWNDEEMSRDHRRKRQYRRRPRTPSVSPLRRTPSPSVKLTRGNKEQKRKTTKAEPKKTVFLPKTKRTLPASLCHFDYTYSSEDEDKNAGEEPPSPAALLAEQFAINASLRPVDRMRALLAMIEREGFPTDNKQKQSCHMEDEYSSSSSSSSSPSSSSSSSSSSDADDSDIEILAVVINNKKNVTSLKKPKEEPKSDWVK